MLSIFFQSVKDFIKDHQEEIILAAGVILISLLSFALGFIAAKIQEKEPLRFERGAIYEFTNFGFPLRIIY